MVSKRLCKAIKASIKDEQMAIQEYQHLNATYKPMLTGLDLGEIGADERDHKAKLITFYNKECK